MTISGTVVNGVVVWDGGAVVPEGTRVCANLEKFEYPHPMAPYDREKEIALLQASHDEMLAGEPSQTFEEFRAEFHRDYILPRTGAKE